MNERAGYDYDVLREVLVRRGCDVHGRVADCVNAVTRLFNMATQGSVNVRWTEKQRSELAALCQVGESRLFDAWRSTTVDFLDGLVRSTTEDCTVTVRAMCLNYMRHPVVVQLRSAMATAGFELMAMRQMYQARPVLCEVEVQRSPVGEAADALIRRRHKQLQDVAD